MKKTIIYVTAILSVFALSESLFATTGPQPMNPFELAFAAVQFDARQSASGAGQSDALMLMGQTGKRDMSEVCGRGTRGRVRRSAQVTHYYIPLLKRFVAYNCHTMEGTCRFWKGDTEYIANYGKPTVKLSQAFCKNGVGYGLNENCLHPCRSLAANPRFHRGGEVIFFKNLVGKKCGTGKNQMIHDGFMVVNDTGSTAHFNREGRFDFFWGECRRFANGRCLDQGASDISAILSSSPYCRAWSPQDASYNNDIKVAVDNEIRTEDIAHEDPNAAVTFNLDAWNASSNSVTGRRLKALRANGETQLALNTPRHTYRRVHVYAIPDDAPTSTASESDNTAAK